MTDHQFFDYLCLINVKGVDMTEAEDKFRELDIRINLLMERCRKLNHDNKALSDKIEAQKEMISRQLLLIEKLEEHQIITETKKTFDNRSDETIKTKQIINEMMREIDQCLLLLEE